MNNRLQFNLGRFAVGELIIWILFCGGIACFGIGTTGLVAALMAAIDGDIVAADRNLQ